MKRSWIKRKATTPLAKIKGELMELAKKFIKLRDGPTCWTCGAKGLEGTNFHGGHFIADSIGGVILRYDENNIHPQCLRCNHFLSGNQAEYYIRMVKEYGQEFVDEMFRKKHQDVTKWGMKDYQNKIEYYKEKIAKLNGKI